MEKYEVIDLITKQRFELMGVSKEQKDSFEYKISEGFNKSVHISHINIDCYIVYNKSYVLNNSEVEYFYNDLIGGNNG